MNNNTNTTTTANTITIDVTKQPKFRIVEEGKSRLTPFEATYLVELWCNIVESHLYINSKYRLLVCDTLRELEWRNPDWHFRDFENWVKGHFSDFTKKDWRKYIKQVNKEYIV